MTDSIENYAPAITTLARTILARMAPGVEGLTLNWSGGDLEPRNAYAVGGVIPSLIVKREQPYEIALLALVNWLALAHPRKDYAPIGVWADREEIYFDLVTILPYGFRDTARAIAAERGEIAFGEFDAQGHYKATHNTKEN